MTSLDNKITPPIELEDKLNLLLEAEIKALIKTTREVFTSTNIDSRKNEGVRLNGIHYIEEVISAIRKDEILRDVVITRGENKQPGAWYSIDVDHYLKKYVPKS